MSWKYGPSEEDHNKQEFKRLILAEFWTNWKSLLKQEMHHLSGPQLNIIASIFDLLKTFSEIIVASKCGPLARIKKQAVSLKLDLLKCFSKIREAPL